MNYLQAVAARIRRRVPKHLVSDNDTETLFLMYAVLALSKGTEVTPEDVHNAWNAWMVSRGESHDAMVPYSDLSEEKRQEDRPFADAIRDVASEIS